MHIFIYHNIAQFTDKYGALRQFSMQGAEKLNDIATINFFQASNKHKVERLYKTSFIKNK